MSYLKRAGDLLIETVIGIILVTGYVADLFITLPKGITPNWEYIAFGVNTLVVFGFSISWYRDAWKCSSFWVAILVLLLGHTAVYLSLLHYTEGLPLMFYVVLNPVELTVFTPFLRKIRQKSARI